MQQKGLLAALLALLGTALAQTSNPSITSPSLTECQPVAFTIAGTNPPFLVAVLPGGMVNAPATEFLPTANAAGTYTWTVNLPSGSNITMRVTDAMGMVGYSSPLVINPGQSSACVSGSASVQQVAAATTGSSGSASSGPTYTIPIDILPQFATPGVLVPMATKAPASSGSASGSGAGTTFTVAQTSGSAMLSATLIVQPKAFTGIAIQASPAASATVQATEVCTWGSTITTTVVQPTVNLESGIGSIRVGFSGGASATSSGSAASAGPTTLTGYSATCSDLGAFAQGQVSTAVSTSYANFAVQATFGSDGYFTWLSNAPVTGGVTASGSGSSAAPSSTGGSRKMVKLAI